MNRRLFVLFCLIFGFLAGIPRLAAATGSSFIITPTTGGAGTVVQVRGTELYDPQPLTVWLVLALDTAGPGGAITKSQPLLKLGTTHPDPGAGHAQATVRIPARLPDGRLLRQQPLGIQLTAANDAPVPDLGVQAFTLVPRTLPITGAPQSRLWLVLLGGGGCVIGGLRMRWRRRGASPVCPVPRPC